MTESRYIIGIDLGTSNTVVAYAEKGDGVVAPEFRILDIPQAAGRGVVEDHSVLPSFVYMDEKGQDLPWGESAITVGRYARSRGAEVPGRLISSAKSWLSSSLVDREAAILPWEADQGVDPISPVEASAEILKHVRQAWDHIMAAQNPENRMANQDVFLTVPASFDAVARELTVRAARMAGIESLTLLEEPQAAFYAWIAEAGEDWRGQVEAGDEVLVCDVGGGTSDFTRIRVEDVDGNLELERVAVGSHLLVGGDNMDLALAYAVAGKLAAKRQKLDSWQMRALIQRCRQAKEKLLADPTLERLSVSIAGRGSGLIAGTIKEEVTVSEIEAILMNGFFPNCEKADRPEQANKTGLSEFGLAYESDPGITRHLASFLSRAESSEGPTAILFNGGVMKPSKVREHLRSVVGSWQGKEVRELDSSSLDLSVAIGAAYYGWARSGDGIRIRSGLNQSYYIKVAASMPAIPGIPMPTKALCLAPFGMEEGTEELISDKTWMLAVGEDVGFELLASSTRSDDASGEVVEDWEGDIRPITRIEMNMDGTPGDRVPVQLMVRVTEVGTLEFYLVSTEDSRDWKLSFNLRDQIDA